MSTPGRGFGAHVRAAIARTTFVRAFLLAFTVIAAWHADVITDPPYWDALMGAFVQGHWHATHSYSPVALMRDASFFTEGGACTYPFSIYPTLVGLLETIGLAPVPSFVVLHVLSFLAAATIVAGTFELLRREVAPWIAATAAAAILAQPSFRALACQMNMDVLLAACTVATWLASTRGRVLRACAWATLAVLVKPTGILVVVALLATGLARTWWPATWSAARPDDEGDRAQLDAAGNARAPRAERRAWLAGVAYLGLVFALFVAELFALAHYERSQPGVALFGGVGQLLGKRLWTLPEFGLALAAFAFVAPFQVWRIVRGRATPLAAEFTIFLCAFVGFYFQYSNVLPRYFVQAWPALVGCLVVVALQRRASERLVALGLAVFGLVGLLNSQGRFHPWKVADWSAPNDARPLLTTDGWLLERSLAYRDGQALDRALVARAQELGTRVVVHWPLLQMLSVPRLGYVDAPVPVATTGVPLEYAPVPVVSPARLDPTEDRVFLLSPNVYDDAHARIQPGDTVLEVIERGRWRAFLVRRPPGSGPEGR